MAGVFAFALQSYRFVSMNDLLSIVSLDWKATVALIEVE